MVKIVIAKQLAGKKIITNDGEDLGRLIDLEVSEGTGKIENLFGAGLFTGFFGTEEFEDFFLLSKKRT